MDGYVYQRKFGIFDMIMIFAVMGLSITVIFASLEFQSEQADDMKLPTVMTDFGQISDSKSNQLLDSVKELEGGRSNRIIEGGISFALNEVLPFLIDKFETMNSKLGIPEEGKLNSGS